MHSTLPIFFLQVHSPGPCKISRFSGNLFNQSPSSLFTSAVLFISSQLYFIQVKPFFLLPDSDSQILLFFYRSHSQPHSLSSIPPTVIKSQPTNPFFQTEGSGERCSLAKRRNWLSVAIPRQLCWIATCSRNGESHASSSHHLTAAHGVAIAHLLSTKPAEIFINKTNLCWAYFRLTKKWKKYPTCSLAKVKMKRISRDKSTASCL